MKAYFLFTFFLIATSQQTLATEKTTQQGFTVINTTKGTTYSITVAGSPNTIKLDPGKSYKVENLPKAGVTINGPQLDNLYFLKEKCGSPPDTSYCLSILEKQ